MKITARGKVLALGAATLLLIGACTSGTSEPDADATDESTSTSESAESDESTAQVPDVVADASIAGLRILLTNDDSMQAASERATDGIGLYEMRRALCEAGADVVVIAPWAVQSGRGTAVTNGGTFTVMEDPDVPQGYEQDCADTESASPVYGLCLGQSCTEESGSATPTDTVKFALRGGLNDLVGWDSVDLVISGPNSGLNVGSSVNDSGTVGAAVAGIEHHVPAFAVSSSASSDFSHVPMENYEATSAWTVALLQELVSRDMLNHYDFVTNINYPDISENPAQAAQYTEVGDAATAFHSYSATGDGVYDVGIQLCDGLEICEEDKSPADWQLAFGGNITVSALTWDRSYAPDAQVSQRLAQLQAFVAQAAPAP
ncbi:MAG: 5'/3'-nucleotidase SurE [Beutenbergiaceae bacterium]